MELLQNFADLHLFPGAPSYGSGGCYDAYGYVEILVDGEKINDPIFLRTTNTKFSPPKGYNLKYLDGTACSASHAFSDVYYNDEIKRYLVVTDVGFATYTGQGSDHNAHLHKAECSNIIEVFDELLSYCGHDPNSAGELFYTLIEKCPEYQGNIFGVFGTDKGSFASFISWLNQQPEDQRKKLIGRIDLVNGFHTWDHPKNMNRPTYFVDEQ